MTQVSPSATYEKAVEQLKAYNPSMILGHLCWYSIPETRVDHSQVVQEMVKAGLDHLSLPPVPRPSDVFKRVCTLNERKNVSNAFPGLKENYKIVEVGKDKEYIWRNVVREAVDLEGHKVAYDELFTLQFNRLNSHIHVTVLDSTADSTSVQYAREIVEQVKKDFVIWQNSLTSYAIRELTRHTLEGMGATAVRPSGGVYFVRQEKADLLAKLEVLINNLPGGCSMYTHPLMDESKHREMLRNAYEAETVEEIDRVLGEMTDILSNGKQITSTRFAKYGEEYNRLTRKTAEYSDLLDEAMVMTAARLELFQTGIVQLMDAVKG